MPAHFSLFQAVSTSRFPKRGARRSCAFMMGALLAAAAAPAAPGLEKPETAAGEEAAPVAHAPRVAYVSEVPYQWQAETATNWSGGQRN